MKDTIQKDTSSKKKDSKWVKRIKQNMYRWHRMLGIITVIPAILWCLSGIMHPFMAHFFKPEIANEKLELQPIDKNQLQFSIQEILDKNKITEFKNFRIVKLDSTSYYQVKTNTDTFLYFDTKTAKPLPNGDHKYAEYLARFFLADQKSSIKELKSVTEFTAQYKYVNRYLPVYKLSFDRPDGMQVYVETSSSKLATYNPYSRQAFIWVFDTFHNWAFIDWISNNSWRISIMILFLSIIAFSALSGILIYVFLWKKFKKEKTSNETGVLRKYHRQIGIFVSLFTLTFAFSGGYHATQKWTPSTLSSSIYEPSIKRSSLTSSSLNLNTDWNRLQNMSLVSLDDTLYYRCQLLSTKIQPKKSKWGKKESPQLEISYINAATNKIVPGLDFEYAQFLVYQFTTNPNGPKASCCEMGDTEKTTNSPEMKLKTVELLTDFDKREYGFVNKRLPVVKLAYESPENTTYYIETASSRLAAVVTDSERLEGYSFAFFHKFLYMDWAGKNVRDFTSVLAAFSVLIVSILGLILFLKKK